MINFNLAGDTLVHCLKVSGADLVVVDAEEKVRTKVDDQRQRLEELGMQVFVLSEDSKSSIAAKTARRPDDSYRDGLNGNFPSALFYTR